MAKGDMKITDLGNMYELKRAQWNGNVAYISKDQTLLDAVCKYTWTYSEGKHPYIRCGTLGISLHEFVLQHIYDRNSIQCRRAEGYIIEHLDNNGLNCTYENLHMLSVDLNKAKAFTIDKANHDDELSLPAFVLDAYYLHAKSQFQLQVFLNENLFVVAETERPIEMFVCLYDVFDMLFLDWLYLLNCRTEKTFDVGKLHAEQIWVKQRPAIQLTEEEKRMPIFARDGVFYYNLDAHSDDGYISYISKTALRNIDE